MVLEFMREIYQRSAIELINMTSDLNTSSIHYKFFNKYNSVTVLANKVDGYISDTCDVGGQFDKASKYYKDESRVRQIADNACNVKTKYECKLFKLPNDEINDLDSHKSKDSSF